MQKLYQKILFILSLFLIFSSFAQNISLEIANPNPVGSGARAMGQANAFIAEADDATAASWNPGGLLQLEKPEISFALETFHLTNDLGSHTHPESEGSDSLHLEDFNYASLVYPFYWHTNMVVSLNYLRLFNFDKEARVPIFESVFNPLLGIGELNRIYDLDQEGNLSVLSPAFGVDLTDKLSLGVTLNIWNHDITQSSKFEKKEVTLGSQTFSSFPGVVTLLNFVERNTLEVEEGYSVVIGGLIRLNDQWKFGLVLKPNFELELDHRRTINSGPVEKLNAELDMPMIIGGGVAWHPHDLYSISVDLTWTEWSEYTFGENGTTKDPLSGKASDAGKLDNTYTVRIGSEYLFVHEKYIIPIRCGFGYDPSPAVKDVDNFYTLNGGIGVQLGRYNLDIAYEYRWGNDVNRHFLESLDATQDVHRHRILASLLYYF